MALAVKLVSKIVPSWRQGLWKLHLRELPHPISIRPGTSDWAVMEQIFIRREYDCRSEVHNRAVRDVYEWAVSRGKTPVIIDCGANIGIASVWYAEMFPNAQVIAVEPEPENVRILQINARNYSNIQVVHGAVSDHEAYISLQNNGKEPWAWQAVEDSAGQIITCTIPELIRKVPNSQLLLVKIDIEGSEVALFRSNVEWAAEAPLIVFEAHDWLFNWKGTFHAILSALVRSPRDYIQCGENTFAFSHSLLSPHHRVVGAFTNGCTTEVAVETVGAAG